MEIEICPGLVQALAIGKYSDEGMMWPEDFIIFNLLNILVLRQWQNDELMEKNIYCFQFYLLEERGGEIIH